MSEINEQDLSTKLARFAKGLYYADSTKKLYTGIAKKLLESPKQILENIQSRSRWLQVKTVSARLNSLGLATIKLPEWKKKETSRADHIKKRVVDDRLFEAILNDIPESKKGNELRLAILLSFTAGLKLKEVLNLKGRNIKMNERIEVTVVNKDISRMAIVVTNDDDQKLEIRERLEKFKRFSINEGYARITLNRVSKRLNYPFSFQDFRHAYALRLYDTGISILDIKDLLGLKDPKTTMVYLDINPRRTPEKLEKLGY